MSLGHLWAGWRASYVGSASVATEPDAEGCVFCAIVTSSAPDEERHVVWVGSEILVILNAYPYSSGHVMVMPARHVRELEELTPSEGAELWQTVHSAVAVLKRAYSPDGINLGVNLGRAAGAGIPGHLHVHAVPRWIGDTNFMTTAASVRVMPEPLSDSWKRLRAEWE